MTSYTKLFSSLLTSTIWAESDQTRIVWVTMLAMADQHGEVHSTVPGLARIAGVPLSEVEAALAKFTGPDPYSRTKDNDGRRIAEIDGGWELLNHAKYRAMASREDSKAQAADRQRRKRERDESRSVTPCHAPSRSVTDSHASVTQSLHIAEAEAEAEAKKDVGASAKPAPTSDEDFIASLETNEAYTGIDIRREFVRMKTWCDVNRKKPTQRRFVNWLNRADRPMDANQKATGGNQSPAKPKPVFVQIKELESQIWDHPANPNALKSRVYDPEWTGAQKDADKADYKALRVRLEALQQGQTEFANEP